jgi:hypothetical protein
MTNFIALTPPLGQQPWGPVNILAPAGGGNALLVALPANVSLADFGYPPLNSVFRAVILSKYPGTIFPDPELQDGLYPQYPSLPSILRVASCCSAPLFFESPPQNCTISLLS